VPYFKSREQFIRIYKLRRKKSDEDIMATKILEGLCIYHMRGIFALNDKFWRLADIVTWHKDKIKDELSNNKLITHHLDLLGIERAMISTEKDIG
jgi:hypothetical protein